ncbi:hypothetical protein QE152_g4719 [Popillia japonica]|uniref:Uncharacterized protein n=1 Tax=Popillia japonica TaxID=7064 RepID=A0AAW1N004_POPJA
MKINPKFYQLLLKTLKMTESFGNGTRMEIIGMTTANNHQEHGNISLKIQISSLMNFYRRIQWCDRFRDATHGLEVTAPGRITGEASPEHAPPMPAGGGHVHPDRRQNTKSRLSP